MVSLTAVVWLAIAAWLFLAVFVWAAFKVANEFDRRHAAPVVKVRKPRARKPIDTGRRDDEAQ